MKAKEAAEIIKGIEEVRGSLPEDGLLVEEALNMAIKALELFGISEQLPSAQPEIIRCKDCKFYSPMNRETKTGICNLTMHQNFGDNWFCAGAERRTDD